MNSHHNCLLFTSVLLNDVPYSIICGVSQGMKLSKDIF